MFFSRKKPARSYDPATQQPALPPEKDLLKGVRHAHCT